MASKKTNQKNFTMSTPEREAFEAFCAQNGYREVAVFWAGVRAVTGMSHDERMPLFAELAEWLTRFVKSAGEPSEDELKAAVTRAVEQAADSPRRQDGRSPKPKAAG